MNDKGLFYIFVAVLVILAVYISGTYNIVVGLSLAACTGIISAIFDRVWKRYTHLKGKEYIQ